MKNTAIEWTDATWNPIRGCSRVSEGCRNCYAEVIASRFSAPGLPYEGLAADGKWTGKIAVAVRHLDDPLRWRRPRRIFVNSMSDLFHDDVDDSTIDRIFAVMALAPRHTFQILTKRPERMREYLNRGEPVGAHPTALQKWRRNMFPEDRRGFAFHPLPNVWLGVSVEDQETADERIPLLLETPAAIRFVSAEPLLGPVDASPYVQESGWWCPECSATKSPQQVTYEENCTYCGEPVDWRAALDWVIVGGESGDGARPMHPDWARGLRDQCVGAGVPFFFKQWGEYQHGSGRVPLKDRVVLSDGSHHIFTDDAMIRVRDAYGERSDEWHSKTIMSRVGKRAAGRALDGRTWDEMPAAAR